MSLEAILIYLIGGAPRSGKSVLCHRLSEQNGVGWISTDALCELLRLNNAFGVKTSWDAKPEAILASAEWFYPYLERFVWTMSSMADNYAIEGVDFLPRHVTELARAYAVRAVFLGNSEITLESLARYPGRSHGYANQPIAFRERIVADVPRWSDFISKEAQMSGCEYVDTAGDFTAKLQAAERILLNTRA